MEQITIKKIDSSNYLSHEQLMRDRWYECVTKISSVRLCIKGVLETLVIYKDGSFGMYINKSDFLKDIEFQPVSKIELNYSSKGKSND